MRTLQAYIDSHPRATQYLLDTGDRQSAFWTGERSAFGQTRSERSRSLSTIRELGRAARSLSESADANSLSITVEILGSDFNEAEKIALRSCHEHGVRGMHGLAHLWLCFLFIESGRVRQALAEYANAANSDVTSIRIAAAAAGLIRASEVGSDREARSFARILRDESPPRVCASIKVLDATRGTREGASPVDRLGERLWLALGPELTSHWDTLATPSC